VPSVDITFSSTGNQDRVYYTLYDNTAWMALGASFSNKTNLNNAAIVKAKYVAAVRDSQGVDILYITDIINRKLYYGRN
jgi:hypothetical protein